LKNYDELYLSILYITNIIILFRIEKILFFEKTKIKKYINCRRTKEN